MIPTMKIPASQTIFEENIFLSVRVRPLTLMELISKDEVAWDCNKGTISCRSNCQNQEESESEPDEVEYDGFVDEIIWVGTSTNKYSFGRVFGPTDTSQEVYNKGGAKKIVLSALDGISASVIAYGQTGSGKTFTMMTVAENAIWDIYRVILDKTDRDFVLKVSAFEVCNETVVDLLKQKLGFLTDFMLEGITVRTSADDLAEVAAEVSRHLSSILVIKEAVLKVSAISDRSSGSSLIIRLTVENRPRQHSVCKESYISNVDLVDLAGSELVEGSNFDRGISTLRDVFRYARRSESAACAPLYESKLTTILAEPLMGNTRTAIICTMSPALSAVEQSRNTLSFARDACTSTKLYIVNKIHPQNDDADIEARHQSLDHASLSRLMVRIREMKKELKRLKLQRILHLSMSRRLNMVRHEKGVSLSHIFKLKNRLKRKFRRYKKISGQVSSRDAQSSKKS